MKLLSIAVPCYNSENYMENCIKSLLPGGDDVEILIVNDGSSDSTGEIADRYARMYPNIVRAIHQINAGHGGAVNTGLKNSAGLFFKVVDSDDWVDRDAYEKILAAIRGFDRAQTPDMILSNYVYEKQGKKNKKIVNYTHSLPCNKTFSWDSVKRLVKGQYILMHSVIYRTQLLKDSGMELPKHTFYVDNLFVFQPLPFVKTLYYLDTDFYRYFIGRDDQSVNEAVMIKRVDQQIKVTRIMIDIFCQAHIENKKLYKYMRGYLEINLAIASILLLLSDTDENLEKKKHLWLYLRDKNKPLYTRLRRSILGIVVNLPGSRGRKISLFIYKTVQKHFGFN